jgi:hypothetical protein
VFVPRVVDLVPAPAEAQELGLQQGLGRRLSEQDSPSLLPKLSERLSGSSICMIIVGRILIPLLSRAPAPTRPASPLTLAGSAVEISCGGVQSPVSMGLKP